MAYLVTVDGRLIHDDNEYIYVYDPSVNFSPTIVLPDGSVASTVTGGESTSIFPDLGGNSLPCGIFVTPDEQYLYLTLQSQANIKIFDAAGHLIKYSDDIPNYTRNEEEVYMHDSKIYFMKDNQHMLHAYDEFTIVKHDLSGNYVNHYTHTGSNFHGVAFAEDSNNNIYFASRYGFGIDKLDANMTLIEHLNSTKDILGLEIVNDKIYMAAYLDGFYSMNVDGTNLTQPFYPEKPTDVKLSADGNTIYVVSYDNFLYFIDVATGNTSYASLPYGRGMAASVNMYGDAIYITGFNYTSGFLAYKTS